MLKRLVRRATAWQIDPLVAQVNALRAVTIQALDRAVQTEGNPPDDRPPTAPERMANGGSSANGVSAVEPEAATDHRTRPA